MCNKMFAFMCYCIEPTNLLDQVHSTLCADRLRGLGITVLFQFRVPLVTWNYLLFYPSGHHWRVLFTGIHKVEFPKASVWHWKQSLCNRGNLCLAVTYQVTQSFWLCKQKSQEVSWHCTFKSRKKTFNIKISLHNTSCICLHFPVSYAPPLIVFPCENVYSASHSSQPPHSLLKMPFKALFSVSGFESAFDFGSLPSGFSGVPLYSFGIEISLDFGFTEQMLRDS